MDNFFSDLMVQAGAYYSELVVFLPRLVLALVAFFLLWILANRSKKLVTEKLRNRTDDSLLAMFMGQITKIVIVLFAFLVGLKIIGLADIAAGLITGASVSAIVIGFAFKDIAENFLAGIILAFNRPFRVGDTVELDSIVGKVVSLEMRTTHMKSFDGKDIYIPNANIIKKPVVNYTIDGFLRQDFVIGLDYSDDPEKAIELLSTTMDTIKGPLKENKSTNIFISNLGTSTIDVTIQYWLDTFDASLSSAKIKTTAIRQCLANLEQAGFYLPGDIIELKKYQGEAAT